MLAVVWSSLPRATVASASSSSVSLASSSALFVSVTGIEIKPLNCPLNASSPTLV